MPAMPAADLAALDALYQRRAILIDDYRAGREFAFLAERRHLPLYRLAFMAAQDVLIRSGGWEQVRAAAIKGQMPGGQLALESLADGLDALATHFRAEGLL